MSDTKVTKATPTKLFLVVVFWLIVTLATMFVVTNLLSAADTIQNCVGVVIALGWIYCCLLVMPNQVIKAISKEVTVTPPQQ